MSKESLNRRDFVKSAIGAGVALKVFGRAPAVSGNVLGSNGNINVALIGVGGRGEGLLEWVMKTGEQPNTPAKVVAVSDVYAKRLTSAKEKAKCDGFMDYREILERKDVDAVIIATPDHWHARMAIEAMDKGKDVYLEKPMTHTVEEAKRVYEKVTQGIAEIAKQIRLGPPLDPTTEMGPLISARQQQRVLEYIASGRKEGAEVLVGGAMPAAPGSYVQPTVLTHVKPTMRVVREEIFGPVLTAASFSDTGDVLRRANDTQFGLAASIWTRSLDVAHAFIREFKAGTVWVNTHNMLDLAVPFGGVRQSGIGHELGEAAIEHHTHLKAAILSLNTTIGDL